jgi:hypothetical protein
MDKNELHIKRVLWQLMSMLNLSLKKEGDNLVEEAALGEVEVD